MLNDGLDRADERMNMEWQPIETAPKDNKRPLWLARFNDDGTIQSFDYNGSWERESESWRCLECITSGLLRTET